VARWPKVRRCLLPPLSFGGARVDEPSLRFHIPLIEPDVQISRIRLSDDTHALRTRRPAQHPIQDVAQVRTTPRRSGRCLGIELALHAAFAFACDAIYRSPDVRGVDSLRNLLSVPTSCVRLELRSLPSTGVTRRPRYYEPLRHPIPPGPSLTGDRSLITT
jgi:hypothetical protein